MLKRIKAITLSGLAGLLCTAFASNTVLAEERLTQANFAQVEMNFEVKSIDEFIPFDEIEIKNGTVSPKREESFKFYRSSILSESVEVTNTTGDSYESNEGSETASSILFNKTIKANLNTEADQDWYKFDITSQDVKNCPRGKFVVILKNVPAGKDYDMYLFKHLPDGNVAYRPIDKLSNSVATSFEISEGSYMVAVFAKDNIPNNFSDENYELYVGNMYVSNSTEYLYTKLEFDFGFNKYPMPFLSKAQYFDLSNEGTLPSWALMKEVRLTSDGNGRYWIGLTKAIDGYKASVSGIDYINIPQYEIPVKANHAIQAYITRSDGFVWKPRVWVSYVYPLIEENYRFYFGS